MDTRELVRKNIIIDAHQDISYRVLMEGLDFEKNQEKHTQVSIPHLKKSMVNLIFSAIFLEKNKDINSALEHIKTYKDIVERNKDYISVISRSKELDNLLEDNKLGFLIHLEGAEPITKVEDLKILYNYGLRSLALTWKEENKLAGGNMSEGNLTELGKEILKEAQKLGMVIDLAHLNKKSFWQVLENTKGPVIVSHSDCEVICNYKGRNLDNEQIRAIAKRRGVIGINVYVKLLSEDQKADVKKVCDHIDYIKNLVGIDYVGLGTDLAGIKLKKTPANFSNIGEIENLIHELKNRDYKDEEIQKFLGGNLLRVIKKII